MTGRSGPRAAARHPADQSDVDATTCSLCGLPTPAPPVTAPTVDGHFCCRGCLEVSRVLDGEGSAPTSADLDHGPDRDSKPESAPVPAGETAFLAVSGMHCATCEAFLEARSGAIDGVTAAAASYPAGLLKVTYDPDRTDPETLATRVSGLGYTASHLEADGREEGTEAVGRLVIGGFFGMMTMLWYVLFLYPAYLGLPSEALFVDLSGTAGRYLVGNIWVMATVVLGYTGYPILRGAYVSLRAGLPNMDLLVALAATTAYAYSTVAMVLGRPELYFDIAVVIVLVVSIGNYYEGRIKRRATSQLTDLTEERVAEARRRTVTGTETVDVDALAAGDEVVVRTGERIPVDGTVAEGSAAVDESLVTGESRPVRREPGDPVIGGGLVRDGGLVVRVGEGAESTADRLVRLLWDVQSSRAGVQRLADRIATVFVPVVVVLALAAFGVHLWLGAAPTAALLTALAVLVVSCPCALGLATPLSIAAGVRDALRDGIVVTDASVFERAATVDVVALDKTGTLTTGEMTLLEDSDPNALRLAAAVEQFADHPVADAVLAAADPPEATVTAVETHPGRGIGGTVDGERVLVGRTALFDDEGWAVPATLRDRAETARDAGRLPALVGWEGRARTVLVAGDTPRAGWADVVDELAAGDRRIVVLTGDDAPAADPFRDHPAVDRVFAGLPPEGKVATVRRLAADGTVAMVGDGSNDAPALAAADVGIALASGTRLAADAADAVVTTGDLATVPAVFRLTAGARRRLRANLGWAFLYNVVAVPLALVGLINPLLAAIAMAASSLVVVGNSARRLPGGRDG